MTSFAHPPFPPHTIRLIKCFHYIGMWGWMPSEDERIGGKFAFWLQFSFIFAFYFWKIWKASCTDVCCCVWVCNVTVSQMKNRGKWHGKYIFSIFIRYMLNMWKTISCRKEKISTVFPATDFNRFSNYLIFVFPLISFAIFVEIYLKEHNLCKIYSLFITT